MSLFILLQIRMTYFFLFFKYLAKKKDNSDAVKLLRENITLISELNKLRELLKVKEKSCKQFEILLGLSSKYISPTLVE